MSWRALQFALDCDKCTSTREKIVLVEYANHADERGYSWPSLKSIATRWHTHPTRLRRARDSIIAKKLLFCTKKRRGWSHQNKVFRMPKCTYERGSKSPPSKKAEGDNKWDSWGSKSPKNLDTDNLKPISGDNTLGVISTTGKQTNAEVSDSFLEGYQNQNQPARDHPSGRNTLLGVTASSTSTATPASPTRKVSALGYPNKTRNGVTRRHPTRTASLVGF